MQAAHRIAHTSAVLALAQSSEYLFTGTQDCLIHVYAQETYEPKATLRGHNAAILSLVLANDEQWLVSTAGDSIVRIWCTQSLTCLFVIYSTYDVGDILAAAAFGETLFLGAQNTSLQWVHLAEDKRIQGSQEQYPSRRHNKFFDSAGPGGRRAPRRTSLLEPFDDAKAQLIEIGKEDVVQYAHYSYVYCLLMGTYHNTHHLFSGGGDGAINVWSVDSRPKQVRSLCQAEQPAVHSLVQHESLLYAGQARGLISVWDLETDQLVRRLQAPQEAPMDVLSLQVMGHHLLSSSAQAIHRWNIANGCEHVATWQVHTSQVVCTAIRDSLLLTCGGSDVALWRLAQDHENPTPGGFEADPFMTALQQFTAFRSISGSPHHVEECRRAATYLKQLASSLGADSTLLPTQHNPIVLIKFKATSQPARRILYYGHYDVISADAKAWRSDPWQLTGRNGYLYGRGVSDNKGPVLAALFAAHTLRQAQRLKADLTFLVEGEEESGSRGFQDAVLQARQRGDIGEIDEVFLSNSYWLDDQVPCLTYGLRGVVRAKVTVESQLADLHSGVEGGSVREPTIDLVSLLASLTHKGKIQIEGFYEPVRTVSADEQLFYEEIAKLQLVNPLPRSKPGLSDKSVAEVVDDLMNRWCRPSLTLHQVSVSGPGNNTIIPHAASAKLSLRIVPDHKLSVIVADLKKHLEQAFEEMTTTNTLSVDIESSSNWWLSDPTSPSYRKLAGLVEGAWGIKPLNILEGGSIPMLAWLDEVFDAQGVHFPMGQSSDQAHLTDERLRILNLSMGRKILLEYFGTP
ncbi:hypothetical protein BCR37DRAFT_394699 [Protomyces lactucae-debilis]|uniref:Peptidase M20 dimerisation domain-containing protein n=1 Tax=Protomyces lactucae-debilis TaxID=2754530 RepID=A0A1Y2F2T0_PROLT|nr:uncharacterized protein BCR37DRAFT_394699 [Protomyces lactucae-debilis]ORY78200.1 hypothetical protein BCR37DRAFT_394699 [Protomyces lactucae-debilis]